MKKIILALTLMSVLFLVGCGGGDSPAAESGSGSSAIEETSKSDDGLFSGSIKDLMTKAVPMKCTWNMDFEGESSEGTIYVKGDKFRTDISTDGETYSSMSDGRYLYSWSTLDTQGIKMGAETMDEPQDFDRDADISEFKDFDVDYNYKCIPWTVSNSKFTPPSDIEFMDMTKMMEEMQEMAGQFESGDMGDACSFCEMIPEGPDRDDCLADC